MNKNIMIIVYGGFWIGMGHVVRMKLLAKELLQKGYRIFFYTNEPVCIELLSYPDWFVHLVPSKGNQAYFNRAIEMVQPDLLIIDVLEFDLTLLNVMKSSCRDGKIVLFEEKREDAWKLADVVINGIYGGFQNDHVHDNGLEHFNGTPYLLLENELRHLKEKYEVHKECRKVVVSLGGSDPSGLLEKVTSALKSADHLDVIAVAGSASRFNEDLSDAQHIQLLRHTTHLPLLLFEADLALIAGGVTLYEAICIGVPSIVLSQVEHQTETAAMFAKKGACLHLGLGANVDEKDILQAVEKLSNSYFLRKSIHLNGRTLIDGKGLERVQNILIHLMNPYQKEHKDV
ncbi:PseG/SpsG family protein [Bacillus sp. NPDC077027]|uniref:PseG/SpsG family protein n=1 Tax=Bacillus sp. NPDC077027 TaxID=3390548 RepID=UPI003D023EF9